MWRILINVIWERQMDALWMYGATLSGCHMFFPYGYRLDLPVGIHMENPNQCHTGTSDGCRMNVWCNSILLPCGLSIWIPYLLASRYPYGEPSSMSFGIRHMVAIWMCGATLSCCHMVFQHVLHVTVIWVVYALQETMLLGYRSQIIHYPIKTSNWPGRIDDLAKLAKQWSRGFFGFKGN